VGARTHRSIGPLTRPYSDGTDAPRNTGISPTYQESLEILRFSACGTGDFGTVHQAFPDKCRREIGRHPLSALCNRCRLYDDADADADAAAAASLNW